MIITDEPFDLQGATVYLTECKKEQIRLITDSKDVLTGAITNRYEATSLYSSNNNLKWKYLKMHWPMKYNY